MSAACTITRSANDPQWVKPGCCWFGQTCALPDLHHSHAPQPHTNGAVTRSPTPQRWTPLPTFATTPANSCPGTCGNSISSCPAHACQSLRQRPVARTSTTTPPSGAAGSGASTTSSGPPNPRINIARTAAHPRPGDRGPSRSPPLQRPRLPSTRATASSTTGPTRYGVRNSLAHGRIDPLSNRHPSRTVDAERSRLPSSRLRWP